MAIQHAEMKISMIKSHLAGIEADFQKLLTRIDVDPTTAIDWNGKLMSITTPARRTLKMIERAEAEVGSSPEVIVGALIEVSLGALLRPDIMNSTSPSANACSIYVLQFHADLLSTLGVGALNIVDALKA